MLGSPVVSTVSGRMDYRKRVWPENANGSAQRRVETMR